MTENPEGERSDTTEPKKRGRPPGPPKASTPDLAPGVRVKLGEAQAALAATEDKFQNACLGEAIGLPDGAAVLADIRAERAALSERVAELERALAAAEANDRKKWAAARASVRKAQLRTMKRHIEAAIKEAMAVETALANYTSSWRRMLAAANEAAKALLPDDIRSGFDAPFRAGRIFEEVSTELARLGGTNPAMGLRRAAPDAPGCAWALHAKSTGPVLVRSQGIVKRRLAGLGDLDLALSGRLRHQMDDVLNILSGDAAAPSTSPHLAAEVLREQLAAGTAPPATERLVIHNEHAPGSEAHREFEAEKRDLLRDARAEFGSPMSAVDTPQPEPEPEPADGLPDVLPEPEPGPGDTLPLSGLPRALGRDILSTTVIEPRRPRGPDFSGLPGFRSHAGITKAE